MNKLNNQQKVRKIVKITCLLLISLWFTSVLLLALLLFIRAGRLQQLVTEDPAHLKLTVVASEVHGARREFTILRFELAPLLWLGDRFGGDIGATTRLMDAGVESLIAADELLSALTPSLGDLELSALSLEILPKILDSLATVSSEIAGAEKHLDLSAAALARIDDPLSPRVEQWVSLANRFIQLAQSGMGGLQIAPGLLGHFGPRKYLVLFQNADELRPTGGFISSVGLIEISNGQLISLEFQDSYAIDDFTKEYPNPPQPLLDYMGSEQWVFRDANWSPDFPETAMDAIMLYKITQSGHWDGVIGLNNRGIEMLIKGLEPLIVPGLTEPVTSANMSQILRKSWDPSQDISRSEDWLMWYSNRKQIIGMVFRAAIDNLLAGNVNWKQLGLGMIDAFSQRQMMIYTSSEADKLRQLGWDGSLHPNPGDFLMVVDANLGFSKTNVLVSESLNYQVTLLPDGTGSAVVGLNYTHLGTRSDVVCTQYIPYDQDVTYEKMIHRCYFDYLRLVVPPGSNLRDAIAHPVKGEYLLSGVRDEGKAEILSDDFSNWTIFGQFFVVEYGKQLSIRFDYDLPLVVSKISGQNQYTLYLQKQSGTDAMPVIVRVILPAQAQVISTNPSPSALSSGELEFDLHLNIDQQIEVIYALTP